MKNFSRTHYIFKKINFLKKQYLFYVIFYKFNDIKKKNSKI